MRTAVYLLWETEPGFQPVASIRFARQFFDMEDGEMRWERIMVMVFSEYHDDFRFGEQDGFFFMQVGISGIPPEGVRFGERLCKRITGLLRLHAGGTGEISVYYQPSALMPVASALQAHFIGSAITKLLPETVEGLSEFPSITPSALHSVRFRNFLPVVAARRSPGFPPDAVIAHIDLYGLTQAQSMEVLQAALKDARLDEAILVLTGEKYWADWIRAAARRMEKVHCMAPTPENMAQMAGADIYLTHRLSGSTWLCGTYLQAGKPVYLYMNGQLQEMRCGRNIRIELLTEQPQQHAFIH